MHDLAISGKFNAIRPLICELSQIAKLDREYFMSMLLKKLAKSSGGVPYFCRGENFDEVVELWANSLLEYSPKRIFDVMNLIFEGLYNKNGESAPRSVLDFKQFILDNPRNRQPAAFEAQEEPKPHTEEEIKKHQENTARIKALIKEGTIKMRKKIEESTKMRYNPRFPGSGEGVTK